MKIQHHLCSSSSDYDKNQRLFPPYFLNENGKL